MKHNLEEAPPGKETSVCLFSGPLEDMKFSHQNQGEPQIWSITATGALSG